jgi:hypothetical protein
LAGELVEVRRVTVVAETVLQQKLLEQFQKLGARGYTCSYCFGKGRHEVVEDPCTGRSLVKIVILARESVATAIMRYIHTSQFESYPAMAYMDSVVVFDDTNF